MQAIKCNAENFIRRSTNTKTDLAIGIAQLHRLQKLGVNIFISFLIQWRNKRRKYKGHIMRVNISCRRKKITLSGFLIFKVNGTITGYVLFDLIYVDSITELLVLADSIACRHYHELGQLVK